MTLSEFTTEILPIMLLYWLQFPGITMDITFAGMVLLSLSSLQVITLYTHHPVSKLIFFQQTTERPIQLLRPLPQTQLLPILPQTQLLLTIIATVIRLPTLQFPMKFLDVINT